MTASNFDRALSLVLQYEGGYADHPRDPGGLAISPFDASTAAITKYDGAYGAATGQILYGSFTYVAAN